MGHSMQGNQRTTDAAAPAQKDLAHASASAHVRVFANQDVWLETSAIDQLEKTACLPHIQAAVGLPDLHPGRGYPIGAAFFSVGHFYPALVGGDIGCGMSLWRTDLKTHQYSSSKLEKQLGSQEGPLPPSLRDQAAAALAASASLSGTRSLPVPDGALLESLGTIGGGNHFAEVLALDTLYALAPTHGAQPALNPKTLYLLVHSGSRGLGGEILREHLAAFGHAGLAANTDAASTYWAQHQAALAYGQLNRWWIAQRFLRSLRTPGECLLDVHHNHVVPAQWQGQTGFLHRKGATPADQGWVMIPGSRGDYSYLVRPVEGRDEALFSLAHGAGRKWARTDCQARLAHRIHSDDLRKTRFGSRVVCEDKGLLYEEAPNAYKDVDSVVNTLVQAGLVELLARFKPVLTYKKGQAACC